MDELDYRDPGLTVEQRFRRLMETAGLSTLVVAMTNVVAFGLGAISDIPAIHWCVLPVNGGNNSPDLCLADAFTALVIFLITLTI